MRNVSLLLALLFSTVILQAQSIAPEEIEKANIKISKCKKLFTQGAFDEILELTQEVYDVAVLDSMKYDSLIAEVYYTKGRVAMQRGEYDKAKTLVQKSLEKRKKVFGQNSIPVVKSLDVLASVSFYKHDYQGAEHFYFKCWEVLDSIGNEKSKSWGALFLNLGGYYYSQSDYQNAILYFEKAVAQIGEFYGGTHVDLCFAYINLGVTKEAIFDYESAIKNYQHAKEIHKQLGTAIAPYYLAHIQFCLGVTYLKNKEFGLSRKNLNESLKTLSALDENNYALKAMVYNNLGEGYVLTPNKDKAALENFNKSIEYNRLAPSLDLEDFLYSKIGIAKVHRNQKEFDQSLAIYQSLSEKINYNEENFEFDKLLVSSKLLIELLEEKLSTLLEYYKEEKNVEVLQVAELTAQSAFQVIDIMKLNMRESVSKQNLLDSYYPIYEKAMEVSYLLHEIEQDPKHINTAFSYSEKSKGGQLMEAVLQTKAEKFAGIPKDLLEQEQNLKVEITKKKKEKHKLESKGKKATSVELSEVNETLFDLKIEYEQLIQNFEKNYPKYHSLKYGARNAKITQVQQEMLSEDQTIVEYFVGEEDVYVFVINEDDVHFQKLDELLDFKTEITDYYNSMRNYQIRSDDRDSLNKAYVASAYTLYQFLVEPIESHLSENVVVIPDGLLNYLPFAALLKELPEDAWAFKTHDYLLGHYNISYNYSTTLMDEMATRPKTKAPNNLLAIAPSFLSPYRGTTLRSEQLLPLEHNENEIETILQFCKGKSLTQSEANMENFMANAADYKAIHFATHGVANETSGAYSYIAFTLDENTLGDENILFGVDIYNLDLNAEMVVLSACETAAGELKRGEGVISTARAFSFAGARNLITTLWKVSDSKATDLMSLFYQELQNKKKKDLALRDAKQAYIQNNKDHLAHPFYWASFISIGNTEAIDLQRPFPTMAALGAGLFVLLALAGYWFWKRRRNKLEEARIVKELLEEAEADGEVVDGE